MSCLEVVSGIANLWAVRHESRQTPGWGWRFFELDHYRRDVRP